MSKSYLRFKSFVERDACEVAVKDNAAAGMLIVGLWRAVSKWRDVHEGDRCAMSVMEDVLGRDKSKIIVPGGFNDGKFLSQDRMDGRKGWRSGPGKAGPEALAFALQQIRDADIG